MTSSLHRVVIKEVVKGSIPLWLTEPVNDCAAAVFKLNSTEKKICFFFAEVPKPQVEERVTIIREHVVNGKVVSSVVDTQTEKVAE